MSDQTYQQINGVMTSWSNLKLAITGTGLSFKSADIASLKWDDEVADLDKAYGEGPRPRGRGVGRYVPGAVELGMWHDAGASFQDALASVAPTDEEGFGLISLVHFAVIGSWRPLGGPPEDLRKLRISGCRVQKRAQDLSSEDGKPHMKLFTLDVSEIIDNGVKLL